MIILRSSTSVPFPSFFKANHLFTTKLVLADGAEYFDSHETELEMQTSTSQSGSNMNNRK